MSYFHAPPVYRALKKQPMTEARFKLGSLSHTKAVHLGSADHPLMVISGVSSTTGRASPAPASVSTTGPIPL